MRILVVSDQWFPDLRGGSARVATDTARLLATGGHQVTAVVPEGQDDPSGEAADNLIVRRVLPRGRLPMTLTDVLATRREVARDRIGDFDVVLAHQSTTALGALSARLGVPLVLVVHALPTRELRFDRSLAAWPGRARKTALLPLLSWVERQALRRADRLLVLSRFTRSLLEEDAPEALDRVVAVSGGVDTEAFSPGEDRARTRQERGLGEGDRLLFTARRLEPRMGLENLLDTVRALGPSGPQLAVAGSGSLEAALRRRSEELEIAGRVRFLGRVSDAELVDWYRAADVFVLPTVAYEGFGIVTAEALACGTPVVGTRIGATPELLDPLEAGLVSDTAEPAALAATIANVLPHADEALRERCRAFAVERLAWERVVPLWEAALDEAVSAAAAGQAAPRAARSPRGEAA